MDYSLLRQEGIRLLERMTGGEWTDFNLHDPGITLLEQLCYVLSDLGYRSEHPIPDLLAEGGAAPDASLHPPHAILSTQPITAEDLRRLVLDVDGVKNAWVEPARSDPGSFYFLPPRRELRLLSSERAAQPIALRGLQRVLIDPSGEVESPLLRAQVARRLHAVRGLGQDLAEVTVLQTQPIQVEITLEVAPLDDPPRLLADVRRCLSDAISPSIPFASLAERQQPGTSLEDVFDGPLLRHGFLPSETLARFTRRSALYTSDLMHALMNLPLVRAVSRIRLAKGGSWEEWSLPIDADRVPRLDAVGSKVTLRRAGQVIHRASLNIADSSPPATAPRTAPITTLDPPTARSRQVGRYTSAQTQLPMLYGIGEAGLPQSSSDERKAKAKQLKAYLLFFDQLCANSFAQLAHVADLFSFRGSAQTHFTQAVDQPELDLDAVRPLDAGHRARLQSLVEAPNSDAALQRRNRFLNHLLARFAEPIADYTLATSLADRAAQKQALLQSYPTLSSARGTAEDLLHEAANQRSGLEQRLRLDLGLDPQRGEDLLLIEHILLRPIKEDLLLDAQGQARTNEPPLLAAVYQADPFSLQLSFVLPDGVGRFAQPAFKQFIEDQLRQRLPAHLVPWVHWLSPESWSQLRQAHHIWQQALRVYTARTYSIKLAESASALSLRPIDLRGARDRLIDLLHLGETYPLADTSVYAQSLTVGYNMAPTLYIDPAQVNVRYQLCDEHGTPFAGHSVDGSGGLAVLQGPSIQLDHTFTIRAFKIDRPERQTTLLTSLSIKIGLNTDLPVWLPQVSAAAPLVDYGAQVEVRIAQTQAGARYSLLNADDQEVSQQSVMGNAGEISLFTQPLHEDTVLRVRAIRDTDLPEGQPILQAILDTALPLAVRANPSVAISVEGSAIHDHASEVTIRIQGSQRSVTYTAYACTLYDADFPRTPSPDVPVLRVPVPGATEVYVRAPAVPATWQEPSHIAHVAQAVGTDGDRLLSFQAMQEDSVVIVKAFKSHSAASNLTSTLQLVQSVAILLRPAAMPGLRAVLSRSADATSGQLLVSGGQPGVFYFFRARSGGELLGLPAYFHKRDDSDPTQQQNRGLGQTWLQTDLVVARDPAEVPSSTTDLTRLAPADPLIDIAPLPSDGTVFVTAVKARTGVAWSTGRTLTLTSA